MKSPLLITLAAAIALVATACADAEPDLPSVTSEVSATAAGTSEPSKETVQLNLLASLTLMGDLEPMRRILEEQDSFVSLALVDTPGGPATGAAIMDRSGLEERKHLVLWTTEEQAWFASNRSGGGISGGALGAPMVLMKIGPLGCSGVGTLDPDILTFSDLDGKTLQGGRGPSRRMIDAGIALGIEPDHVAHGGDDITVRELKSGQLDASYYSMTEHDRPAPRLLQLLLERDGAFFLVDVKEAILAVQAAYSGKWPFLFPVPLFRGDLQARWNLEVAPIRQEVVHCFGGQNTYLAVSPEMDFEVAYEMVFQLVSNRDEFTRFLAGNVEATTATLGLTYRPQRDYHPGARQAYEDLNYPYGLEDTIEHHKQRAAEHNTTFDVPRPFLDLLAG